MSDFLRVLPPHVSTIEATSDISIIRSKSAFPLAPIALRVPIRITLPMGGVPAA